MLWDQEVAGIVRGIVRASSGHQVVLTRLQLCSFGQVLSESRNVCRRLSRVSSRSDLLCESLKYSV